MLNPKICGVILLILSVLVLWFCVTFDCDATGGVFYLILAVCMLFVKDEDNNEKRKG